MTEAVEELLSRVNLDDLPIDMIQTIMATLSLDDVKSLCQTSRKLENICKKRDLIEMKARQRVMTEAPLGQLVAKYNDYVDLIDRGFKTVYHIDTANGRTKFGVQNEEPTFSIVGLPPPRGTTVWVFCDTNENVSDRFESVVFPSLEELRTEMIQTLKRRLAVGRRYMVDNGILLYFSNSMIDLRRAQDWDEDEEDTDEDRFKFVMEQFDDIRDAFDHDAFFYIQVDLP